MLSSVFPTGLWAGLSQYSPFGKREPTERVPRISVLAAYTSSLTSLLFSPLSTFSLLSTFVAGKLASLPAGFAGLPKVTEDAVVPSSPSSPISPRQRPPTAPRSLSNSGLFPQVFMDMRLSTPNSASSATPCATGPNMIVSHNAASAVPSSVTASTSAATLQVPMPVVTPVPSQPASSGAADQVPSAGQTPASGPYLFMDEISFNPAYIESPPGLSGSESVWSSSPAYSQDSPMTNSPRAGSLYGYMDLPPSSINRVDGYQGSISMQSDVGTNVSTGSVSEDELLADGFVSFDGQPVSFPNGVVPQRLPVNKQEEFDAVNLDNYLMHSDDEFKIENAVFPPPPSVSLPMDQANMPFAPFPQYMPPRPDGMYLHPHGAGSHSLTSSPLSESSPSTTFSGGPSPASPNSSPSPSPSLPKQMSIPAAAFHCPHCPARFRIKGYLTRHLEKHATSKAYTCPFFDPTSATPCHASGGFSRRDTYKTHLKSRHFVYPAGTRSDQRVGMRGWCASCGMQFSCNESWVENHVEGDECRAINGHGQLFH
ncbi:uncharacterized protein V1510DRAFT_404789 [Dipodascopsis tothii]|uniref:uncharacterized protein n=1 Tax=Dipodascopsis tothii TaxID=44089 RepID=UPI0034CE633A